MGDITEHPHLLMQESEGGWHQFYCDEHNTPLSTVSKWNYCPLCGSELGNSVLKTNDE